MHFLYECAHDSQISAPVLRLICVRNISDIQNPPMSHPLCTYQVQKSVFYKPCEEGQDIVCAAVSALIITTVNSLEKFTEEQIEAEADEGYVSIHFKTNPNTERGKLLMDSLILGLTEIEHSYNNRYLTVKVKEV